jgi:hypothetical protein
MFSILLLESSILDFSPTLARHESRRGGSAARISLKRQIPRHRRIVRYLRWGKTVHFIHACHTVTFERESENVMMSTRVTAKAEIL